MKITYKQRIFFIFLIVFGLFALGIITLEQNEEKGYRTRALEQNLDGYTEIIHSFIDVNRVSGKSINTMDSLLKIFPDDLRVTVIDKEGRVIYDKNFIDASHLENHIDRPEIKKALYQKHGSNIRMSASTDQEYLYFAKFYSSYYVRVALPYNIEVKSILNPDRMFIYVVVVMFVVCLILLNIIAGRFGKSIHQLKKFTIKVKEGKDLPKVNFPDDELGEVGEQLIEIFKQKEEKELQLKQEKEKLIQHFQYSKEGLCIFDSHHNKVYANTRFIQYLNLITDDLALGTDVIFTDVIFYPVQKFLSEYEKEKQNNFSVLINNNAKSFEVQTVVFDDKSFEISIKDVTEIEKTRFMKQEMTSNIAHELRTPVTSLRAYLETLSEQNLPTDKQHQFVHRAYIQSVRLSNLIDDVSLVSKMEEASSHFKMENLNVLQLINDVRIDLVDKLEKNNVSLHISVKPDLQLNGNYTLLYAVFRNLIDNSIDHGGSNIDIYVNNYMEDSEFLYFSYYDTGKGVKEQYLNRIFERFYRIDEGRTRDSGGSGLGLSIVRNAVKFHSGEVQAKNHKGAGLEFLFTLKK